MVKQSRQNDGMRLIANYQNIQGFPLERVDEFG